MAPMFLVFLFWPELFLFVVSRPAWIIAHIYTKPRSTSSRNDSICWYLRSWALWVLTKIHSNSSWKRIGRGLRVFCNNTWVAQNCVNFQSLEESILGICSQRLPIHLFSLKILKIHAETIMAISITISDQAKFAHLWSRWSQWRQFFKILDNVDNTSGLPTSCTLERRWDVIIIRSDFKS